MEKLGALWEKEGKNGKYMTGVIKIAGVETRLVLFRNDRKESDKHPDWQIYLSEPKKEDGNGRPF